MKDDALEGYHAKRDFERTAEPRGRAAPRGGHAFVVQKHAARRLHYDFRLELDGVLKSWAVPKGPSLSPKEKRLAVEVEDHPVDYRDFEGTIPEGQYGGGAVIVWDRGEWKPVGDPHEGLRRGRLDFELDGDKLHGRFLLVRMGGKDEDEKKNWLLFKRSDEFVRTGKDAEIVRRLPRSILSDRTIEDVESGVVASDGETATKPVTMPAFASLRPELATLVDDVPAGPYAYEVKYDGYRILAWLDDGEVRLASRNGKEWTARFPEIADALSRVRAKTAIFDGEVAALGKDGRTDFQALQAVIGGGDRSRVVYFVFDLLYYDGVDLRAAPLSERKAKLRTILAGEDLPLRFGDHVEGKGAAFFRQACKLGLEGIVAKRLDRPYVVAKRTTDWVKVKCQQQQEMVVVGFSPPKGSRTGLGALLLAVHEDGGYRYAGKVGTGFSEASLSSLVKKLRTRVVDAPSARGAPRMKGATWVRPDLVAEIRFTEWTRDGSLRHPTFLGLREDKPARDVVREAPSPPPEPAKTKKATRLSHPDRVVDEASGITKGELARYHEAVAAAEMPYLEARPLMLVRCPENTKSCFVQKHIGKGFAPKVGRHDVDGEPVTFLRHPGDLLELVQWNVIEIHGWGARLPRWDRPDQMVLDLDPDPAVPFAKVVETARTLRDDLARLGLVSFVKTTGGKGLHVVTPLRPDHPWEVVTALARAVAAAAVARAPKELVATMTKAVRKGRIFVDIFRNAQGATAVLPYSPRARPGLPVAFPASWRDLGRVDPADFTVATVPRLLARRRVDPWGEYAEAAKTNVLDPRRLAEIVRARP